MEEPCVLTPQQREELSQLFEELNRARAAVSDRLASIADEWDDQLASHIGNVPAEDRLEALIRWRESFSTPSEIPDVFTGSATTV